MHGRPVVGLGRRDEDVPVQAELLAVVLPDVRVVPVHAGVGNVHLVREAFADRDRRLRVVGAVVAVLEPEPVPVHGRVEIPAVRHVDGHGRAFGDLERRPRDRPVVREHAHGLVPDRLSHGSDLEREFPAVAEGHTLGRRWPRGARRSRRGNRSSSLWARPCIARNYAAAFRACRRPRLAARGPECLDLGRRRTPRRPSPSREAPTLACAATSGPGRRARARPSRRGCAAGARRRRRSGARSSRNRAGSRSPRSRRRRRARSRLRSGPSARTRRSRAASSRRRIAF